ncbi:hypothetical protein [Roseobacter sp. HKCC-CH-9208]|uniref:hypothetical protein n=1 Tax=Roseobacter sp. HKCC-CH-9208 TaxID=3120339 RepID=UPI0030ED2387
MPQKEPFEGRSLSELTAEERHEAKRLVMLDPDYRYKHPDVIFWTPTFEALNKNATDLVDEICEAHGLTLSGQRGRKYRIVVASLLQATKELDEEGHKTIAVSKNNNAFTGYSSGVGRSTIDQVVQALSGSLLERVEGSGGWTKPKHIQFDIFGIGIGIFADVTRYRFVGHDCLQRIKDAQMVEAYSRIIVVNKQETYLQKKERKETKGKPPRFGNTAAQTKFGRELTVLHNEVEKLNAFYLKHPLEIVHNGHTTFAAAAHRVFHEGRLDAGGRFYGYWTNQKEATRLQFKIDGEPVVSIDVNASQAVTFSMLMGEKINTSDRWTDLYKDTAPHLNRELLKKVALEVIGLGDPYKEKPSSKNAKWFETEGSWDSYREALLKAVPALRHLDKKYMNGAGFISYHEAEILKRTIHRLMAMDIPAYSVHDCIIVSQLHEEAAVAYYQDTFKAYVIEHCKNFKRDNVISCTPALKLTTLEGSRYILGSQQVV